MRTPISKLIWLLLLLTLTAGPAAATEGPPIAIQLTGEPRGAIAGEPYPGELHIRVMGKGTLSGFRFESPAWSTLELVAPVHAEVSKNPELRIPFTVVTQDPEQPLVFRLDWDGKTITQRFNVSPSHAQFLRDGGESVVAKDIPSRPPPGWVDPHESYAMETFTPEPPPEGEVGKDRSITVSGRFGCQRPNDGGGTTFMPADDFLVQIRDAYGIDSTEAETYTDSEGYFAVTFTWTRNRDPDLYVRFIARNDVVETEDPGNGIDYKWSTPTWWDYSGTNLDVGTRWPADEFWHGAVQLQTVVTRAMRWADVRGYDCDNVHVEWPDDDTKYTRINRAIHISEARTWVEGSACHEFGHHFLHEWSDPEPNDYCNDTCDDNPPWDCGHCVWCAESDHTAFNEGFPNYLGWAVPKSFAGDYGLAALHPKNQETATVCSDDGLWHEPLETEGFVGAVLQDIHDSEFDDDPRFPGWRDVLSMGEDEILRATNIEDPYSVMDFLRRFLAEYPAAKNGLWETAMNNGFDIDEHPPGVATGLSSLTHTVSVASTNPSVIVFWTEPDDDASGVQGYSILWSVDAPEMPDAYEDLGDMEITASPVLSPGNWYFNVRALDRADHWSTEYASYGPLVIAQPDPVDLTFVVRDGWDYQLVPSDSPSHDAGGATVSATLPGSALSTYFSVSGKNEGGQANSVDFQGELLVDEESLRETTWGVVPPTSEFYVVNEGPVRVGGGRHTLHYRLDANHAIAEIQESDNTWGRQFIWTPYELTPNDPEVFSGVPYSLAGWDDCPPGSVIYLNADGLRFRSTGYWNAVVIGSIYLSMDLDLSLHDPSTGSNNGFAGVRAFSARGPGCVDAVLVNRNTMGVQDWDAGVRNFWGADGDAYTVRHVTSDFHTVGETFTVQMESYEYLRLDEVYANSSNTGALTVRVETNPPTENLYVQWRDDEFTYGKLSDPQVETSTGVDGRAQLQLDVADPGFHCLTIFRDPKDDYRSLELTVSVIRTPPDLTPFEYAGWHSPFVPRPADDGTLTSCPLPTTLPGNAASTYYNLALWNDSPGDAEDVSVPVYLDGVGGVAFSYPTFGGYLNSRINWGVPQTVRGGRHTLSYWIDVDETVDELDNDNNVYGEQYIWTPLSMSVGATVLRDMPPARTGGWDHVRSGEGLWYNSDGLRVMPSRSQWAGIAVMPGSASDVDVRFHALSTGAKDGFATNVAFSGWEGAVIDFVLVHWLTPFKVPLDVGVLATSGTQQYFAQYSEGRTISTTPGTRGPYTMAANDVLDLYELDYDAGTYSIDLLSSFTLANWGLALYPADRAFHTRSLVHAEAAAWLAGAGQDERILFEITDPGVYCLTVFKVGAKDRDHEGEYRLQFEDLDPTGVEETPSAPQLTALQSAYPNPFNARLTVAFDLAQAAEVEIRIHNVTGALVRCLRPGALPAGRHEASWDGRDESGGQVASGTYFLTLNGDQQQKVLKVALVK